MKNLFLTLLFIGVNVVVWSQKVYKTPSGKKYHLVSCRMVNNVSKELTIAEASKLGLDPCKICKPVEQNSDTRLQVGKARGVGTSVQCAGTTKAGNRCKHQTKIANGYCYQHQPK